MHTLSVKSCLNIFLFIFLFGLFFSVQAQPTDQQVIKDMTAPNTISVKLTPRNGHKQWNADYGVWEYVRGVEAIKKYPQKDGVRIKIVGDAVYQMYGATNYKYWKFRVLSNEYLGMDAPSSDELMEIVKADFPKFLSTYWYNRIIGEVKAVYIADDPQFTWHTTNSMSFNVIAEYRARISDIHIADIVQTYTVRLYRDSEDGPWKNFISSRGKQVVDNQKEYPRAEIRAMKTLADIDAERKNSVALSAIPDTKFTSGEALALALNRELRNGTPESVEAFLIKNLAPMYLASGSQTLLNAGGARVVNQAVTTAFKGRARYKDQFCDKPSIDSQRSSEKRIYLNGIGNRAIMQVAIQAFGGGYVNGVKQPGELKITSVKISLAQTDDDIAFFSSFSDPERACPDDN